MSINASIFRSTGPGQKLHVDLAGPFKTSMTKKKYLLVIVDDYCNYLKTFPLPNKQRSSKILKEYIISLETQYGYRIKCVLSDNGGEFKNTFLDSFYKQRGIRQELTTPHNPHQRGKVERHVGIIKNTLRALLNAKNVANYFWDKAAIYSTEIWNVLPRNKGGKCPKIIFENKNPRYDKFRIFGAKGYAKTSKKLKMNVKNEKVLFLGFPENSAGFLVFNLLKKKLQIVRDVVLDELNVVQQDLENFEQRRTIMKTKELNKGISKNNYPDSEDEAFGIDDSDSNEGDDSPNESISNSDDNKSNDTEQNTNDSNQAQFQEKTFEIDKSNIIEGYRSRKTLRKLTNRFFNAMKQLSPPKNFFQIKHRPDKEKWTAAYSKELNSL